MKLLHVIANNFKNCNDSFEIDFVSKSKKTAEDKEYELQEIADDLHVYNTMAFIGKNASGKTTAVELLDACYSILGDFRLDGKPYSYENVELCIDFYHDGFIYRYETILKNADSIASKAIFMKQRLRKKKYYKSKVKALYNDEDFVDVEITGELPEDTSILFFVLKKKETRAVYFDSFGNGADTYRLIFATLKDYHIRPALLVKVISIFDENIHDLQMLDDHNFKLSFCNETRTVSDKELIYMLSSGTTKGMLLYILMAASLQQGFDLIIDEIENHFHKTLVENMIENTLLTGVLGMQPDVAQAMDQLRTFMFARVYTNPVAKGEESKAKDMLCRLFEYYMKNPERLPPDFLPQLDFDGMERIVCDYIAGMTDRYAVYKYSELFIPATWQVR